MKKRFKRTTSLFLALVMVVTAMSGAAVPAFASSGDTLTIDFDYARTKGITTAAQAQTDLIDYQAFNKAANAAQYNDVLSKYKWKHVGRRDVFYKSAAEKLKDFEDYAGSVEEGWDAFCDWVGNNDTRYEKSVKLWKYYENRVGYYVTDTAFNELKPALESTAESDKYIVLDTDFTYTDLYNLPDSIKITTDKVLDLNGYNIYLNDISNRAFSSKRQNDHEYAHYSKMFEITGEGSLTIIDSSEQRYGKGKGTGGIYTNNYMIDVFADEYNYYTSRDIFWVDSGGKLVIYGGTYQAGRYKHQQEAALQWSEIKKVAGAAVTLGTNICEYAYGIKGAQAALQDKIDSYAQNPVTNTPEPGVSSTSMPASEGGSTVKKDGSNGKDEVLVSKPQSELKRNKAIAEKTQQKNQEIEQNNAAGGVQKPTEPENKANGDKSAKEENKEGKEVKDPDKPKDGKNVTLNNLEKNVADAALDKGKLSAMAESAFDLVDGIVSLFTSNGPRLVQSTLGTVAHIGNGGTFVSYGGNYIGTGSTANTRNAVIEVVEQMGSANPHFSSSDYDSKLNGGLAYIYGGDFDAQTGANVFNVVNSNTNAITGHYQTARDPQSGKLTDEAVTIHKSEVYGGYPIGIYDDKPVSTRNITVRGGNFNCSAEISMSGLWSDGKVTMFPGTPGCVNLGIESYGKDYIKDGRIQIRDTYGDGALVLMDETKDDDEQIHHYRLFCSELELRYNAHLQVYPGNPEANTTHSFRLISTNGELNNDHTVKELKQSWLDDENGSERNSAFADNEQYFELPVNPNGYNNQSTTGHYYIMPSTSEVGTDVYGEKFAGSKLWYYSTPLDTNGNAIDSFKFSDFSRTDKVYNSDGSVRYEKVRFSDRVYPNLYHANENDSRYVVLSEDDSIQNYQANLKWFRYKVYRVDPLSRENISEGSKYGQDVPLADIVYGGSNDSLRCMLPLVELENYMKAKWGDSTDRYGNPHFTGFKPGEMYRVVFSVDESISYNYNGNTNTLANQLDTASMTSSVLFTCRDEKNETDYTPLQWDAKPEAGQKATVNIVNGKAGQTDVTNKKIFDVYYQWYEVDAEGNETLLAGTDDIYTGASLEELSQHTIYRINHETANRDGGYKYKNTRDPADYANVSALFDESGMPKNTDDWTCDDFHAYSYWFMGDTMVYDRLFGGSTSSLSLKKNYPNIFETNTDTCYIPESAAGKTVYCKATVVNSYWGLNYDHIQVFKTHPVKLDGKEYTVSVEDTDGFNSYTVKSGEKFTLPAAIESPYLGKEFDRWNIGNPGDEITVSSNLRITAVWKDKTAEATPKVIFEAGDGTGTMEAVTFAEAGAVYTLPAPTFTPPSNQAFYGWEVSDTLGNTIDIYNKGDKISVNQTLICEAKYANRFDVAKVKHPDSADKPEYYRYCQIGKELKLPSLDWTEDDNQYADSWNLGAPGETITVTAEMMDSYGKDGYLLLFPDWKAVPTLRFDANGGSGSMDSVLAKNGTVTLPECTFTSPGSCSFSHWIVNGSSHDAGDTVSVTASTTAYAKWRAEITYDANGGSGSMPDVPGLYYSYYGYEYELPLCGFKAPEPGLVFGGWNLGQPGDKITVKGNITVSPIWKGERITVIFKDHNGAEISKNTYDYGDSIVMPECELTVPDGQAFQGWRADSGMYGYDLQPGQRIAVKYSDQNGNLIFTPHFADGVTVRFDLNGHQMVYGESVADKKVAVGSTVHLPTADEAGAYAVHGYLFKGWFRDSAGTIPFTEDMPVTENMTLYARWDEGYKVQFYKYYELLDTVEVEPGAKVTPPAVSANAGERFTGWYNGMTGDAVDFDTLIVNEDMSFYASFEDIPQISLSEYNESTVVRGYKYTFYGFLLHSENVPAGAKFKWESSDPDIISVGNYDDAIDWSSYVDLKVAEDAPFNSTVTITFSAGDYKISQEVHVKEVYPLTVCGTEVTEENRKDVFGDGNVSFDGSKTLTLLGGNYVGGIESAIDGFIINTERDTTFENPDAEDDTAVKFVLSGDTTFTGKGTLTLNSKYAGEEGAIHFAGETLTFDNAKVSLTGEYGIMCYTGYEPAKKLVIKKSDITVGTTVDGGYAIFGFAGGYMLTECEITTPANATFKHDGLYDEAKDEYISNCVISAIGAHIHAHIAAVTAPTCTAQGYTTYTCACGDTYVGDYVDALGHTVVTQDAVPATCQATGKTEGAYCSVCHEVLKEQKTVEKVGHTLVIDPEVAPTCMKPGKTVGSHCSVCGTVFAEQEEIEKSDHLAVTDKAVPATCTEKGKTAGSHCKVCGTVIKAQSSIPATGHTEETVRENEIPATCKAEGSYDEVIICSECDTVLSRETKTVAKAAHNPATAVTEMVKEATCSEAGIYEDVVYCLDCGAEISRSRKTVPAFGHTYTKAVTKPTCTAKGYTTYTCSDCNETYIADYVGALGHKWDKGKVTATTATTYTMTYTCSTCKESYKKTFNKKANPLTVKGKTAAVKLKNVKKKAQTVKQSAAFAVSKAQGKVTYAKASGSKNITVAKDGKLTVKKGTKKGTYKIKVKVTAAGNSTYKKATKTVTVTINVK